MDPRFYENRYYLLAFLGGLGWTTWLSVASTGVILHDEIGHYMVSENAWRYPELMLDVWGRSVNTLLYMPAAQIGYWAAEATSIVFSALTVLISTLVARQLNVRLLVLIPLLLWGQPWFASYGHGVHTEIPFSLICISGFYFWFRSEDQSSASLWFAGLLFGLLPLVRHEGILFTGLFALINLPRKQLSAILACALPLLLYNILHFVFLDMWAFEVFLQSKPTDIYGSGSWWHFIPRVGFYAGPLILLPALLGIYHSRKISNRQLFLLPYGVYTLAHMVIFKFGLFASGGFSKFLLPIAPAIAITAAWGIEAIVADKRWQQSSHRGALRLVNLVALCSYLIVVAVPHPMDEEGHTIQEISEWLHTHHPTPQKLLSFHPWLYFKHPLPWRPGERWDEPPAQASLKAGTLFVWDDHYCDRYNYPLAFFENPGNGWQQIYRSGNGRAIVFEKAE